MASIQRYGKGWRAFVARGGKRASKTFATKREASDWAARQEYLIEHAGVLASRETFGAVMTRYAQERSPAKRGARWEIIRLAALARDSMAAIPIGDLSAADLAEWRQRRLAQVSPGSVRREMNLLSVVLTVARREWQLISANPMADVRQPPPPRARERLPTSDELEALAKAAGDDRTSGSWRAFAAFRFACETAMRAGEICTLTSESVDRGSRLASLAMTKNGQPRMVPLSSAALAILDDVAAAGLKGRRLFGFSPAVLDATWRRLRVAAKVDGLTFHDSRHEGTTRLARVFSVLELARITGHRDINMLLVYYNEPVSSLAAKLP